MAHLMTHNCGLPYTTTRTHGQLSGHCAEHNTNWLLAYVGPRHWLFRARSRVAFWAFAVRNPSHPLVRQPAE